MEFRVSYSLASSLRGLCDSEIRKEEASSFPLSDLKFDLFLVQNQFSHDCIIRKHFTIKCKEYRLVNLPVTVAKI